LVDRLEPRHRLENHARRGVLEKQLAAAATGHEHVAVSVNAREGDELSATRHVEARHERALRAQADTVRRVFNVATRDDAAVIHESRRPHRKVRVRNVRLELGLIRRTAQCGPIDVTHSYSFAGHESGSSSFNLTGVAAGVTMRGAPA